mmetsp:Transcript_40006/g.66367  ORF Transcript_40006/g.66367 Transcript_40006/m.66367 type:complete len:84 (-) Transcript_40006:14-265(-)
MMLTSNGGPTSSGVHPGWTHCAIQVVPAKTPPEHFNFKLYENVITLVDENHVNLHENAIAQIADSIDKACAMASSASRVEEIK